MSQKDHVVNRLVGAGRLTDKEGTNAMPAHGSFWAIKDLAVRCRCKMIGRWSRGLFALIFFGTGEAAMDSIGDRTCRMMLIYG